MPENPELTFEERIKCGYMYFIGGCQQHDCVMAFNSNNGRVSEACTALAIAATYPKEMREAWDEYCAKHPDFLPAKLLRRKRVHAERLPPPAEDALEAPPPSPFLERLISQAQCHDD